MDFKTPQRQHCANRNATCLIRRKESLMPRIEIRFEISVSSTILPRVGDKRIAIAPDVANSNLPTQIRKLTAIMAAFEGTSMLSDSKKS